MMVLVCSRGHEWNIDDLQVQMCHAPMRAEGNEATNV